MQKPGLKRDLKLTDAVGVGLGAIIGAGIFVVSGVAAGMAGPAVLVSLLLAGVAATCNALSSAQLAAAYPQSGGTYEYGYRVLNPHLGFIAGWLFLCSKIAAGGVVALGFGHYFTQLIDIPVEVAAVGALLLLTAFNYFGIKKAGYLNLVILSVTIGSLIYFSVSGMLVFNSGNFQPFAPAGWQGILKGAAILFFAYTGYARIATLGEEVHEPEKTIPKAIIITIISAILLYAFILVASIGGAGMAAIAEAGSPLESAAAVFPLPGTVQVIGIGAITAMLGVFLSQIFGISRMMFAMARKKDLPAFLEKIHPRYHVPHWGIFITSAMILLLIFFSTLTEVISAAAFTILLYYSIANLAAIKMPREKKLFSDAVPVLGLASCLLLAFAIDVHMILTGVTLIIAGFFLRRVFRKLNEE